MDYELLLRANIEGLEGYVEYELHEYKEKELHKRIASFLDKEHKHLFGIYHEIVASNSKREALENAYEWYQEGGAG